MSSERRQFKALAIGRRGCNCVAPQWRGLPAITIINAMQRSRAAHVQGSEPATSRALCTHWTPREQELIELLVDHMLDIGRTQDKQLDVCDSVYIDSTLATDGGQSDRPLPQDGMNVIGANVKIELDASWTELYRVGVAATELFCWNVFGKRFDALPDVDKQAVLRLLDSIKLVFQDGSHAGVFFAAVYQTLGRARS
jgi:hypothetical protein